MEIIAEETISTEVLEYQSNRFAQDLGHYCHNTIKQFLRYKWLKIFGHESSINVTDLATNSHCPTLNTDFYRIAKLPSSANRKLINPFKWLEFIITVPFELIRWGFHRGFFEFRDWFLKHCGAKREMSEDFAKSTSSAFKYCFKKHPIKTFFGCILGCILAIGTVATATFNEICLSIPKRILAPVRYIIRPSIELAKTHSKLFLSLVAATVVAGVIATTILTGGLNLGIGGLLIGLSASIKTCIGIGFVATVWSSCLKAATGIKEVYGVLKNIFCGVPRPKQIVSQFNYKTKGSTTKITEQLHGLNPTITDIKEANQQNCSYKTALFFGVEALAYPSKGKKETAKTEYIKFFDLKKYAENKKQEIQMEQKRISLRPC